MGPKLVGAMPFKTSRPAPKMSQSANLPTRVINSAPAACGHNQRQARAAQFLSDARVRRGKAAAKANEGVQDDDVAVCTKHGIPECSMCLRKMMAKKPMMKLMEVEATSLNIGPTSRPCTGAPPKSALPKAPLSECEQRMQARLFRHKRAAIQEACCSADSDGDGMLSRQQFSELLGQLMLHPGEQEFRRLWGEYDPQQVGHISHASWLQRFVASISLPDGVPPRVKAGPADQNNNNTSRTRASTTHRTV